jgi:molybdate transport system substrate-binding protein
MISSPRVWIISLLSLLLAPSMSLAAEVSVAVAANFTAPMKIIAQHFERETGHKALLAFGSTGQFYAQIKNGAPFGVLLAADEATPLKIEQEGLGLRGSSFTYAIGTLVLWSNDATLIHHGPEILQSKQIKKIALANPKLAPYGAAAIEVLTTLGVLDSLNTKIVEAANIGQAFQFVASGNASLGFVALSQVFENGKIKSGSAWIVPTAMHTPIKQNAVLLNRGQGNPAAQALLSYLQSAQAQLIIRSFGYDR